MKSYGEKRPKKKMTKSAKSKGKMPFGYAVQCAKSSANRKK